MNRKLMVSVICLHILAALLVAVSVYGCIKGAKRLEIDLGGLGIIIFSLIGLGFAALSELVAFFLRRGSFFAWIAALLLFVLCLPWYTVVLGLAGLWGLLNRDVRTQFLSKR